MSKRQSVTFSDQAIEALRAEAKRIGVTVSDLLRRIVDQWKENTHPTVHTLDLVEVPYDEWLKSIGR